MRRCVQPLGSDIDPYDNDPGRWGHSMVNLAEVLIPCLDAAGARSVVEVGAYAGDLTRALVEWAETADGHVWAIDPSPHERLVRLAESQSRLELVREPSLEALGHVPMPDALVIDGDHNYYTVSEELRIVFERTSADRLPLLLFHDVCWPHARRDDYFAPDQIPAEWRHPIVDGGGLFPGVPGTRPGGLPYRSAAAREGGARNGVLTAVEDFTAAHEGLRLAVVSAFFGLGVVWPESAPWSDALAGVLAPWDRNPLLERLEANRVLHLASGHYHLTRAANREARNQRLEALLRRLLDSSAFGLAERLSQLRRRSGIGAEHSQISKDAIRRVLAEPPPAE